MSGHTANTDSATPARLFEGVSIKYSNSALLKVTALWRRRNLALALICAIMVLLFSAQVARAQETAAQPLLFPGNAVVTGFSGTTTAYSENDVPENSSLADETFLNRDGASLRVIELEGARIDSDQPTPYSPQLFDVRATEIGQVFGVALDDAKLADGDTLASNIYGTATSAYGLYIVGPDADGDSFPERLKVGAPDAKWMPGLFGSKEGGGPGSVWKIDGVTGEVSLFANIEFDGAPNSGPGLGNIVFDSASRQLFVSDRDTGMIHRLSLQGEDRGSFDHGLDGRPARGLHPVGFDPDERTSITTDKFVASDPETWGYASPERRVWGLAMRQGRLYYAVAEGPQIWSVAINKDGSFGRARWEIDLPEDVEPYEVSDITFTSQGRMVLAQRGKVTGAYDYAKPIESAGARVLRYRLESPPRRRTPSRWIAEPDEYAIGQTGDYRNTDGGVAIGYGYTRAGNFNYRACRATLWTTGDRLKQVTRRTLAPRPAAVTEDKLFLDGLQGNALTLVRPENEPPTDARFVDYDGAYQAAETSGHVGDVEIPVICDPEEPYAPQPPPPPAQRILDLEIEKKQFGVCSIFDICSFEITVRNRGTESYRGPLVIRDLVSQSGMDLVSFGAVPWRCVQSGVEISCRRPELVLRPGRETHLHVDFRLLAKILIPGWRNCSTITWLGDANEEATIRAVQLELSNLGFYAGPIDGQMTPATNQAISDLEIAAGLPATGSITPELLEILYGSGAHRAGDANPDNDHDCADVEYIAVAAPGPGPGPGPVLAALKLTIGGPAECPFGEECPLGLTIRNNLPVPFDQEIDGLVELKRLGVEVPEQIAQWPSFCAGPVGQMDVNCRFRLQLGPNQARSYPMRLNIQHALLDPNDAANQAPDGVIRAEACFVAENLGWFGWLFGQEIDRDCHSFVVPGAGVAPGGPGDLVVELNGPPTCVFGKLCAFDSVIRNTGNVEIRGKYSLWDDVYVPVVDQRLGIERNSGAQFTSSPRSICTNALPSILCDLDFDANPLAPGEARPFSYSMNLNWVFRNNPAEYDPSGQPNRSYDARNCNVLHKHLPNAPALAVAEGCHEFRLIADENPPQAGFDLWINTQQAEGFCIVGDKCRINVDIGNYGPDAYEGDLIFNDTIEEGITLADYQPRDDWDCQQAAGQQTVRCQWIGQRPLKIEPHPFASKKSVALEFAISGDYQAPEAENTAALDLQVVARDLDASNNLNSVFVQILREAPQPIEQGDEEELPELAGNLEITKTARKSSCRLEAPCLFDITVKNAGFATTGDRIRFIETFPEGLRNKVITSSDGSINCSAGAQNQFVCTGGRDLDVAPGQEFKLEAALVAAADNQAPGLENCVTLDKDGDGAAGADEVKSCAQVKLLPPDPGDEPRGPPAPPELTLTMRAINTTCKPGIGCWFKMIVTNTGRNDFRGELELRDLVKIGTSNPRWPIEFGSLGRWRCDAASDALEYRKCMVSDIAARDSRSLALKVLVPQVGDLPIPFHNRRILTNCASIHYPSGNPNGEVISKQACAGSNIDIRNQVSFLKVEKLAPANCPAGGRCEFHIRIQARGERGLAQSFTLIDQAKKIGGTQLSMPIVAGGPGCSTPPDRIPFNCRRQLSLPPFQNDPQRLLFGENVDNADSVVTELSYQVEMPAELKGGDRFENCFQLLFSLEGKTYRPVSCTTVSVTGPEEELDSVTQDLTPEDEPPADEPPARQAPLAGRFGPQLSVTKVANSKTCTPGTECPFSISIANRGVAPYFGSLVFSERMKPGNVRLVGSAPSPWRCQGSNGKFTCSHPSTRLDVGASKTVRLRFRTSKAARGNLNNCAQFTWRDSTAGAQIVAAKQALSRLGFNPGPLDARLTKQTRDAIRRFQRQQDMRATGAVDTGLMKALVRTWGQGDQNAGDDTACTDVAFGRVPDTSTPVACPQGQRRAGNGCVPICTGGRSLVSGRCECRRGQVFDTKANRCRAKCSSGTRWGGKQCVSRCPEAERWDSRRNRCVNRCSSSQRWDGKSCVNRCSSSQRWNSRRNRCINRCSSSQRWDGKSCVARCTSAQRWDSRRNRCVNRCSSSQRWDGKSCVARCSSSQRWDARRNRCINRCTGGKQWRNNRCQCPSGQTEVRGKCTKVQTTPGGQTTNPGPSEIQPIRCSGGKVPKNGKCVCPTGQFEVRGKCTAIRIQPGQTINPKLILPR